MRPYQDFSDQQIIDEIKGYRQARKDALLGKISVIAGEGRRVEYAPTQIKSINNELRELYSEAARRNMPIAGDADERGALRVEIG